MKPSEIQVGRTFVSKNGKRRRLVVQMPLNQVLFLDVPSKDGQHHNVLLVNFARWAKEEVK